MSNLQTLLEMGFTEPSAQRALEVTSGGLEAAMEWLLAHGDSTTAEENIVAAGPGPINESNLDDNKISDVENVANSLKCSDCNRVFKDQSEVEFHAAKTGHIHFTESTEQKLALTDSEKKEQLSKLEEKLKQKRKEREEREKQDVLDRERSRIQSGKDMTEMRRKLEEDEMKKIINERKREKLDDKQARERVRMQIEADKLERKRITSQANEDTISNISTTKVTIPLNKTYNESRIQIRLLSGKAITQTFDARAKLETVKTFLQVNHDLDVSFSLMTTFPRKVFAEEDFNKALDELGLVPSAVLIVSKSGDK